MWAASRRESVSIEASNPDFEWVCIIVRMGRSGGNYIILPV